MIAAGEVTNSLAYFPASLDVFVLSHVLGYLKDVVKAEFQLISEVLLFSSEC